MHLLAPTLGLLSVCSLHLVLANQTPLIGESAGWELHLDRTWDVLGPFPQAAREQHIIGPDFPLQLTGPYTHEPNASFPSSWADGGQVTWSTAIADEGGDLEVSFPNIRWDRLRSTDGWAALQHHALLHTTLTVTPPSPRSASLDPTPEPHLTVELRTGSYFAILPSSSQSNCNTFIVPEWHAGNIYDAPGSPISLLDLPGLSTRVPTKYDVFVSGDYEIRLFGDPQFRNETAPKIKINFKASIEIPERSIVKVPRMHVVPDVLDGWLFGKVIAVGVRSLVGDWELERVESHLLGTKLTPMYRYTLSRFESRALALRIEQLHSIPDTDSLSLTLHFKSAADKTLTSMSITIPLRQVGNMDALEGGSPILGTHYLAGAIQFLAVAPRKPNGSSQYTHPPILLLHGAGVDIVKSRSWAYAVPRQEHSWILLPTGRTPWGYDWRGPSLLSAWDALDSLIDIIPFHQSLSGYEVARNTKAVIMGHSNGGQGTWFAGSRYPDRVLAIVPASGYTKAQSYISIQLSRISHFMDPALRGIMDASLSTDDNDLFLSNLVHTPVLAIVGGDDENVPTWHSREMVSLLKAWDPDADAELIEVPGKPHWWAEIFRTAEVQAFLDRVLAATSSTDSANSHHKPFTLTVSNPNDSGSMHGFRIKAVTMVGRLARLHVQYSGNGTVNLSTTNVDQIALPTWIHEDGFQIIADQQVVQLDRRRYGERCIIRGKDAAWKAEHEARDGFRVADILNAADPIAIVYNEHSPRARSLGLRLSHSLALYLQLDSQLLSSTHAANMLRGSHANQNVVHLGMGVMDICLATNLGSSPAHVKLSKEGFTIMEHTYQVPGTGGILITTCPHQTYGKSLYIWGVDETGLERAAMLFPFRTGVAVPEWMVVDSRHSHVAAAGFWGAEWLSRSEPMSWLG